MNDKITFLKPMLPGFLPLFAFVIFDSLFEVKIAILLTIRFSIIELIFHLIKNKKFEGFLIFDIALISVLGLISLKAGNPLFFKLKPAIIEFIITIILAVSVFTPANILLMMRKRYLKGMDLNETQLKKLQKSSLAMFIIFAFHTALIVYASLFLSHKTWAFIIGVLFYILFGIYMVYEILRNKISAYILAKKYRDDEWFDLLDKQGNIGGKAPSQLCHNNPELIHGIVHMHIFDKEGNLLLQKHVDEKDNQSAKWNTSINKHIPSG